LRSISARRTVLFARTIARILQIVGGITFFFGDRALREFWHWRFVDAELCGIGGGILLIVLGSVIQGSQKQHA
jgi:hypothetical protein